MSGTVLAAVTSANGVGCNIQQMHPYLTAPSCAPVTACSLMHCAMQQPCNGLVCMQCLILSPGEMYAQPDMQDVHHLM